MTRFDPGCLLLGAAVTASAFGVVVILKDMTKQKSWEQRVAEARAKARWHEERQIGVE